MNQEITDSLERLFVMQWKLNNKIFEKKGIKDLNGKPMLMGSIYNEGKLENIGPNTITNEWLGKFLMALNDECLELKEELLWKWWSKDTLNMQNIRVEIVDILHFWICLALSAGMNHRDVIRIYEQKNELNLKRNQSDYSKENKIDDNKDIV